MNRACIISAVICAALSVSVPAYAMEISANEIRTVQEYSGNAQVVFDADQAFEISSDSISQSDDASTYSGNVVVTWQDMRLEADSLAVAKQEDGTSLLKAARFSLIGTSAD